MGDQLQTVSGDADYAFLHCGGQEGGVDADGESTGQSSGSESAKDGFIPPRAHRPPMSGDDDDLYDGSLPEGETPTEDGRVLKFVIAAVLVILVYALVTILLAAT